MERSISTEDLDIFFEQDDAVVGIAHDEQNRSFPRATKSHTKRFSIGSSHETTNLRKTKLVRPSLVFTDVFQTEAGSTQENYEPGNLFAFGRASHGKASHGIEHLPLLRKSCSTQKEKYESDNLNVPNWRSEELLKPAPLNGDGRERSYSCDEFRGSVRSFHLEKSSFLPQAQNFHDKDSKCSSAESSTNTSSYVTSAQSRLFNLTSDTTPKLTIRSCDRTRASSVRGLPPLPLGKVNLIEAGNWQQDVKHLTSDQKTRTTFRDRSSTH